MAVALFRTAVLLWPLLSLTRCQNAISDFDNGCDFVDIPIQGVSFVQASFNLSLDFSSGNAVGILSDDCPLNSTLDGGADLTCIQALLNETVTSPPQTLVICLSMLPAELMLSLAATDPSVPTAAPTVQAANADCDEIDDVVKYGVLGGFGASGLLNIVLILALICRCCKWRGNDDVTTPSSHSKDRRAVDLIVPNKTPSTWGDKSETMVRTSGEDWCVTPNATVNQNIERPRSGTFEYVESKKLKERLPVREDLYVHRPKPDQLEYGHAHGDYADVKPQHTTCDPEPRDARSDNDEHANHSTARKSSSGRFFDDSTSSGGNDQEAERHDSVDSNDPFPRPAAKLPVEHTYRELEAPSMAASGISPEHTYVTHVSDQPSNLEDMTPRKMSAGKRLLSGDYSEVTTWEGNGELRSYL